MPKVLSSENNRLMSPAEYKHIRINVLGKTQQQFEDVIFRGRDRQSAYENGRSPVPPLIARTLRLMVEKKKLKEKLDG